MSSQLERLIVTVETDTFEASYEIDINELLAYGNNDIRLKIMQMQTNATADIQHAESMLKATRPSKSDISEGGGDE